MAAAEPQRGAGPLELMRRMPRVVVAGSLNMDLIVRAPKRPATGETVLGNEFRVLPGGKGLNQAIAAARMGAETHMAGRVGDDDFGRQLLALLDQEHIDRSRVAITPGIATGVGVITLVAGDNAIIVASGANMRLQPEDVDDLPLAPGDICLGQLEVPLETTAAAFRRARDAGARTLLNAAPACALPRTLLELVDILVVNEVELAALSGQALSEDSVTADIAAAARPLIGNERMVIITLGSRGALAVHRKGLDTAPGHRVPAVDTTGAGDCFVGVLAAALVAGASAKLALARANAAAALSVQRPGAAPSMPTTAELRQSGLCEV
jgi:ribokinase